MAKMIKCFAYYSTNLHILLFVCMTVASHKLDTCDGSFNFLAVLSHTKLIELFCFLTGRVCVSAREYLEVALAVINRPIPTSYDGIVTGLMWTLFSHVLFQVCEDVRVGGWDGRLH